MSILKIILHRWNKTTKSHDTIHPETEVAQVTDWNQGIINTLASTALGTLVNTLTSDSLLATMIQKVLTATGVKYNIAQNGYVCLGSFFGGLIIQWIKGKGIEVKCTYPLAMMQFLTAVVAHLDNSPGIYHDRVEMFQIHAPSNTSLTVVSQATSGSPEFFVLIIGR
ncbi:hypothetical protein [uncultured Megasphaera sp.]|uniref:hypothetical protein n=1 Tax=uncultured Megasphaera sp. TaxID=165188 RepID=UPI0025914156|nr:hypothetical protein [uncultured Megasphaera sp.]